MLYQPVIIRDIRQIVSGFTIFTFEEGHHIPYTAGQYLTFVHDTGYEELRRSYSILSAPLLHEPLAIGVRRIDNGTYSRWLSDSAAPGRRFTSAPAIRPSWAPAFAATGPSYSNCSMPAPT